MLVDEVIADSTVLSALLIITTLFTSVQSNYLPRILDIQTQRDTRKSYAFVLIRTLCLSIFSALVIWQLWPTVHLVLETHGTSGWKTSYYLFADLWVGQIMLLAWQTIIVGSSVFQIQNS